MLENASPIALSVETALLVLMIENSASTAT
jgi:hypothetical protein